MAALLETERESLLMTACALYGDGAGDVTTELESLEPFRAKLLDEVLSGSDGLPKNGDDSGLARLKTLSQPLLVETERVGGVCGSNSGASWGGWIVSRSLNCGLAFVWTEEADVERSMHCGSC